MAFSIEVSDVSKRFRLYSEKATTLKERFVKMGRLHYDPFWALRNITIEVQQGESFGLVGANGSGKTTLLKIISGILRPTSGFVRTTGRVAALLELGAGFHPDLSGRENIYMNSSILGLTRKETDRYFDDIVGFAELERFIDNQVKHYSSGMYVRLGFAVAVHVQPEILLVDEVLSVGDEAFQLKCLDKVRQFQREGRTIVHVSHNVDQVREICMRAACLDQGELIAIGPSPEVVKTFRERLLGDPYIQTGDFEEKGSGEIKISSVVIKDSDGRRRQLFHAGEDMELVVALEAEELIEDPVVSMSLTNENGHVIFGTDTAHREIDLGTVHGKIRIRFSLKRLPLLDGTYSFTIVVRSRDERKIYHLQEQAYPFRCINTGTDVGPIHIACDVGVEPYEANPAARESLIE